MLFSANSELFNESFAYTNIRVYDNRIKIPLFEYASIVMAFVFELIDNRNIILQ